MKKGYLRIVRRAFRALRHKKLRHHDWWRKLTRPLFGRHLWMPCRDTVAAGLSIGLFFSMMPPLPFQMVAAALVAMVFRANVPSAMAACWVSNPFSQVFVFAVQFRVGEWLREQSPVPLPGFLVKVHFDIPGIGPLKAASYVLGFLTTGILLALAAYPLVHLFSVILPQYLPARRVRLRVRMPRPPRMSVADPEDIDEKPQDHQQPGGDLDEQAGQGADHRSDP